MYRTLYERTKAKYVQRGVGRRGGATQKQNERLPFYNDSARMNHRFPSDFQSANEPEGQFRSGIDRFYPSGRDIPRESVSWNRVSETKAPTFNGLHEEWPLFRRLFLETATLNHWGEQERYINLLKSLVGDAKTYWISIEKLSIRFI